jgi:hypothetical protein
MEQKFLIEMTFRSQSRPLLPEEIELWLGLETRADIRVLDVDPTPMSNVFISNGNIVKKVDCNIA